MSYVVDGVLKPSIEFELTRLFEKEIHHHAKIENEKRELERQSDFNSIACFTTLDPHKNGFIDFDCLKNFMKKYNQKVNGSDVNAILRRMNTDEDFKIDFREFSTYICPSIQGFDNRACLTKQEDLDLPDKTSDDVLGQSKFHKMLEHDGVGFRIEQKKQILRDIEIQKKKKTSMSGKVLGEKSVAIRGFRALFLSKEHPGNKKFFG